MIPFEKLQQVKEMTITDCLLDYNYFKKYYNMITIDLSQQQVLDADPNAIHQFHFNKNLD